MPRRVAALLANVWDGIPVAFRVAPLLTAGWVLLALLTGTVWQFVFMAASFGGLGIYIGYRAIREHHIDNDLRWVLSAYAVLAVCYAALYLIGYLDLYPQSWRAPKFRVLNFGSLMMVLAVVDVLMHRASGHRREAHD